MARPRGGGEDEAVEVFRSARRGVVRHAWEGAETCIAGRVGKSVTLEI